jgi:hypothetical protein
VRMEMWPAGPFEAMIRNAFGLAKDGKVNRRRMPNLLQPAIFARSSMMSCSLPGHRE